MDMDIHPTAILRMVDQLVTTDDDAAVKTTVEDMRRVLDGMSASAVVLQLVPSETERALTTLKAEKLALESEVRWLKMRLREIHHCEIARDGFYTMEQFLSVLTAKLRRSYGWHTDYVEASHQTPGCTPVQSGEIHKWQTSDKVPEWAVDQIDRLIFRKRTGIAGATWTPEDEEFLTKLYQDNPRQQNATLAQHCTEQFGRDVNESSIKGALDRLRKRGHIPRKRPTRNSAS